MSDRPGFLSDDAAAELERWVVELVERRFAELGLSRPAVSPWLFGAQAAGEYLGWSRQRVYKRLGELPHRRDGALLVFRRDELDARMLALERQGPRGGVPGVFHGGGDG